MHAKELFQRLGYPRHSEKVYQYLVRAQAQSSVSNIALETKLPRTTVYRCLRALIGDSIVEQTEIGKRTYYSATSSWKLEQKMKLTEKEVEQSLSALNTKQPKVIPSRVRFLHGSSGIRAAFDDVISHTKKGDTFFRYTSERDLQKVNQYLASDYRVRRDKKKLERLVISNAASGTQKRSRLERFIKCIPAEANQFEQDIIQLVYGDRVSIIDLEKEEVTIFENKRLAEFQKTLFRLLYRLL